MLRLVLLLLVLATASPASTVLWSIGPNALGTPNQLTSIDVDAQSFSLVATLGSGATSYGGGLIVQSGNFTGFESDSSANVTAVGFNQAGIVTPILPLGQFLPGGLTLASGTGYFIKNDTLGDSSFTNGVLSFALGQGFTGGLAYRSTSGLFYAIQNTPSGDSVLYSIDPGTGTVVALPIALGQGFLGGLVWDPTSDLFYAIGSDFGGNSSLFRFSLADSAPALLFGVGQGYVNAALAIDASPVSAEVPEPSTALLGAAGLLILWRLRRV